MLRELWITLFLVGFVGAQQQYAEENVRYQDSQGTNFLGFLSYPIDVVVQQHPTVIIFHGLNGKTEFEIEKAKELARMGYFVMAEDHYGIGNVFPEPIQNLQHTMVYMQQRNTTLRDRILTAWNYVNACSNVDPNRIAAIGFDFGGLCTFDLAAMNLGLKAAVVFHGDLGAPLSGPITQTSIQIHHGDIDYLYGDPRPFFTTTAKNYISDFQMFRYANTTHEFMYPESDSWDLYECHYQPTNAERAWSAMKRFLAEKLA